MEDNLFNKMFLFGESLGMEAFDDLDLERENIEVPELSETDIAQEGLIKAIIGDVGRDFTDTWKQMKGWFLGIESKRKYIEESCDDTIAWLKEQDKAHPNLDLDMGTFKTWCKTSSVFYWRFYFVLNEQVYKDLMKAIKDDKVTQIEGIADFDMKEREKVTRALDSIRKISELIEAVEAYRDRCNAITKGLMNRKRRIQSFPFQVLLLGYADLNRTVKKIVNLAT